jgi:hypothetical protein
MTEAEERELFSLVAAAVDAKGTPEFQAHVDAIVDQWRDRYEFWLVRSRDYQLVVPPSRPEAQAA